MLTDRLDEMAANFREDGMEWEKVHAAIQPLVEERVGEWVNRAQLIWKGPRVRTTASRSVSTTQQKVEAAVAEEQRRRASRPPDTHFGTRNSAVIRFS